MEGALTMEGAHISWNQESSVPFDVQQSDIILTSGFSIDGDDECRWGTAKTRFGANTRRARLSFCSEESPRASRQRVPAVMVREVRTRAHGDGCGPSLPAPRPRPYGTVMRVGALRGPRTERGLLWRCPTHPKVAPSWTLSVLSSCARLRLVARCADAPAHLGGRQQRSARRT